MTAVLSPQQASALLNVTADSLAELAGVTEGELRAGKTDAELAVLLKGQMGILQRQPRQSQTQVHHEVAARFTPALFHSFKADGHVLGRAASLMNLISYTPYFIRFLGTPAANDITAIFATRLAHLADADAKELSQDQIAEIGQFFSTVLVLQGQGDISMDDKKLIISRLKKWKQACASSFAGQTCERALVILSGDRGMLSMANSIKENLQSPLKKCNGPGCQASGPTLLQCSRCKTTVYCGSNHQKVAWSEHKRLCFTPAF